MIVHVLANQLIGFMTLVIFEKMIAVDALDFDFLLMFLGV